MADISNPSSAKTSKDIRFALITCGLLCIHAFGTVLLFADIWTFLVLPQIASLLLSLPLLIMTPVSIFILIKGFVKGRRDIQPIQAITRTALIMFLLGISLTSIWHGAINGPFINFGIRWGVTHRSDLDEIQSWAVRYLEEHASELQHGRIRIPKEDQPEFIRRLHARYVNANGGPIEYRHIRISWGGSVMNWGLIVAPETYKSRSLNGTDRWRKGVYTFYGN